MDASKEVSYWTDPGRSGRTTSGPVLRALHQIRDRLQLGATLEQHRQRHRPRTPTRRTLRQCRHDRQERQGPGVPRVRCGPWRLALLPGPAAPTTARLDLPPASLSTRR